MRLSHRDQILLQRFFDRELNDVEAAAVQTRLAAEPALQQALDELEQVRSGFVADRSSTDRKSSFEAPAGFTAGVLAEVRQLPNRIELEQAERTGVVLVTCRRVLLAAAVLFGLGLCWHAGLLDGNGTSTLEAAPDEIQREMERLDEEGQIGAPATARDDAGAAPVSRLRLWILGAVLASFAAGVNLGLAAPTLFAAEAVPTPDDAYVQTLAADYELDGRQQDLLRMALQSRRDEELALIGTVEADQLPEAVQRQMRAVQRKLDQRIRTILDEEQRARYDLASRQGRPQDGATRGER